MRDHLLQRDNRYYFNRRVPEEFRAVDKRNYIRISLKTDSYKEAQRLSSIHNFQLEQYWRNLALIGSGDELPYRDIVEKARLLGLTYLTSHQLSSRPLQEILERFAKVHTEIDNKAHVAAVLGGVTKPVLKIDEALKLYWHYAKDKTYNKSDLQYKKWRYPRQRAVNNFIKVVGNKAIAEISRDDVLRFRDWWLNRLQNENMVVNSANKNLIQLKVIIETVSENLHLGIQVDRIFKKILLTEEDDQKRLPFKTDYIRDVLLNPEKLQGLNQEAKCALYIIAETGAGLSEQVSLEEKDIILDTDIPHIIIRPKSKSGLKTKYRKRIIPLIGYALDAFRLLPSGFVHYKNKPDMLSASLSKYLKDNELLPTDKHTVYSLRHSFQDRLLAINAPDRVQADLMGHKFQRQAYGDGASLKQKVDWLTAIQLKP